MLDKCVGSGAEALADVFPGATVLVGGFGESGVPFGLLAALVDHGVKGLTVVSNNSGFGDAGVAALLRAGLVSKLICSYPRSPQSVWFERQYMAGELELELVPQGTLSERIRAGGAGVAAFYTRTGVGTAFAQDKEVRSFGTQEWLLEEAIVADFALVKAFRSDRWGNCTYRKASRNFGPTMVAAARTSVVEVDEIVPLGSLDPEQIVTPGIYVDRVVCNVA